MISEDKIWRNEAVELKIVTYVYGSLGKTVKAAKVSSRCMHQGFYFLSIFPRYCNNTAHPSQNVCESPGLLARARV